MRCRARLRQTWSVVDTPGGEGLADPIGVPDGTHHDRRDQRPGAVFESPGASRLAGLVQCCCYHGDGPNRQREQEGDAFRIDSDGSGWFEETGDHVKQVGHPRCQADQRGAQDSHHESAHHGDGSLPAGGPPLERK